MLINNSGMRVEDEENLKVRERSEQKKQMGMGEGSLGRCKLSLSVGSEQSPRKF